MLTNIEQYLPSRSFLIKVGFIILAIALVWGVSELFGYIKMKREQKIAQQPVVAPLVISDISAMDDNSDGIPDWKQNLQEILGVTATAENEKENINETEQFARDLFTTAATISQSGDLTDQGAQSIADQVTARIASTTLENLFIEKDVIVVPMNDKNISRYRTDLTYLLNQKYPLNIDNAIQITQTALDTSDSSELAKLEPIITRYTNLIDAVNKLSVPEDFKDEHLDFVNTLGKARGSIQMFRNALSNPVTAMSALINYPTILERLITHIAPLTSKIPYSSAAMENK